MTRNPWLRGACGDLHGLEARATLVYMGTRHNAPLGFVPDPAYDTNEAIYAVRISNDI